MTKYVSLVNIDKLGNTNTILLSLYRLFALVPCSAWECALTIGKKCPLDTYENFYWEKVYLVIQIAVCIPTKDGYDEKKCLGGKTLYEVFEELSGFDARIVVQGIR